MLDENFLLISGQLWSDKFFVRKKLFFCAQGKFMAHDCLRMVDAEYISIGSLIFYKKKFKRFLLLTLIRLEDKKLILSSNDKKQEVAKSPPHNPP